MLAVLTASAATSSIFAFQTQITSPYVPTTNTNNNKPSPTVLNAFQLKDGETHNMFEGPTPLVKERDACGVGFIANTNSGGEYLIFFSCKRMLYRSAIIEDM